MLNIHQIPLIQNNMRPILPQELYLERIMMNNNLLINPFSIANMRRIVPCDSFIHGHIQVTSTDKNGICEIIISLFLNMVFSLGKINVSHLSSLLVNSNACNARLEELNSQR
jgi:hypothetical protein